jgi:cysteinyl-tRNA synthetase
VKLVNTLTRQEEEFVPLGDTVLMYVCGVTPYDENHIGHAMSYIVFDVLRRYLEYQGYRVRHVQNFTDIDDRIIARAARLGIDEAELAQRYIDRYFEDMRALNILPAHEYPRATQEIPEMIRIIQGLVDKGYAYVAPAQAGLPAGQAGGKNGDVYYRVQRKRDYGKLSRRSLEDMMAGARVEPGEGKENPMDFALWKSAKPGEPAWDSPWGPGRPGWHIECSAMSLKYLGEQIDIHGGGEDLIFPHHENEIAQAEAFTGKEPFVRYWLHNAWVRMGEEKMSKSLGNFVPVREAVQRWGADAVRLFVLASHYRSPLTYSEEALDAAKRGVERLRTSLSSAPWSAPDAGSSGLDQPAAAPAGLDASPFRERFIEAMDRDLNTPQAVAALFDLAREINRARDEGQAAEEAQAALRELANILGLTLAEEEESLAAAPFIQLLIDVREELRQAKRYDLADSVRSRLGELGIALEDTPQGTVWKRRD